MTDSTDSNFVLDARAIMDFLPHRYPFLLVDRVLEMEAGERIVAIKNVTWNEPYFTGHFPGDPVMPGVLQIEALAQAAAILGYESHEGLAQRGGGVLLMGLDKVRFRRKVIPGDVLRLEVNVTQKRGKTWKVEGSATVEGQRASSALILAAFFEPEAG
jgi:3-hydroxyacyl-[acyl-carrier-protein] dehydratase